MCIFLPHRPPTLMYIRFATPSPPTLMYIRFALVKWCVCASVGLLQGPEPQAVQEVPLE